MVDVLKSLRKIGKALMIGQEGLRCDGFGDAVFHTTPSFCPTCKFVAFYVNEADVHFRYCEECGSGIVTVKTGNNIWKSSVIPTPPSSQPKLGPLDSPSS